MENTSRRNGLVVESVNWTEEQLSDFYKRRGISKQPKKSKPSKSKYGNKRTKVNNITFASKHEAERYAELRLLEKAGEITALMLQVKFVLIKASAINNEGYYLADFVYFNTKTRSFVVEDAKGMKTEIYKIKKKLMYDKHGIEIQEV